MIVSLIWAMSLNRVIGRDNSLPWDLPNELKFFKEQTLGKPVIMGRKTYESLPSPLQGRLNIVLSREMLSLDGVVAVNSLDDALNYAKKHCNENGIDECFVIGGASVYEDALLVADRLFATTVNAEIQGDTHFPKYDETEWKLIDETHYPQDSRHAYSYDIRKYERAS